QPYTKIVPVPVIEAEGKSFKDTTMVSLIAPFRAQKMYYIINTPLNENENRIFEEYTVRFEVTESCEIRAYIETNRKIRHVVTANFIKKPNDYTIEIKSKFHSMYHAGGPEGLIDGIEGTTNWRKGDWQGYQNQDFEAVIDLQKE